MLTALLLSLATAEAKDLRSRVGVGFHQQFGSVTTLSARYGLPLPKPTQNLQVEAGVGMALEASAPAQFFAGGRVLYAFLAEDNLNLYGAAGAGYALDGNDGYVRLQPALGAEFFLFGLENLGFSVEWGVTVDLGTTWRAQTVGTAPNAAVHYYF
jgi:hypothetical protein